jgi:hypothetical protein
MTALMDANEVVVHRKISHRMRVVLDLFRECVGEPGKAASAHPRVQIRPLRVGRADVLIPPL